MVLVKGNLAGNPIEGDLGQGVSHLCRIVYASVFDPLQQEVGRVVRQKAGVVRNLGLTLVILVLGAAGLYELLDYRPRVLGRVVVGEISAFRRLEIRSEESQPSPPMKGTLMPFSFACLTAKLTIL